MDAESASKLVAAATDIALILDDEGIIRDVSLGSDDISPQDYGTWLGQPLTSIVSIDSRAKVGELLSGAANDDRPRWRHLNHITSRGADLPILYSAVRVGENGPVLALGRDMRAMADLQQRLMDVQQSVERDYSKLRHLETRYRLLFQMASEAVLVVDSASRKVVEANPAAVEMLAIDVGQRFPSGFSAPDVESIQGLLGRVQALGRSDEIRVHESDGEREFLVSASLFRQEGAGLFLVRVTPLTTGASTVAPRTRSRVLEVLDRAPDGFVVTSTDGRIISANNAFLEFTQLATEEQARGESLDRWLGRPGVDLNVLTANLREHGSVRLFATTLRGEFGGAPEDVEISAVAVPGEEGCLGFVIRSVTRRRDSGPRATGALPHSAAQLKELVGRMPLRELVRETTDIIERMCIEAALELTGDNRASAAEMLGLSRQSLYVKLRRYNLVDSDSDAAH